jgi:hypothetical protein
VKKEMARILRKKATALQAFGRKELITGVCQFSKNIVAT